MPYKDFPPIFGPFDHESLMGDRQLRKLLGLGLEDTVADWYGHYRNCIYAVVEGKGRHLRDAITQVTTTVAALRKINKPVTRAIIVADTFGSEIGIYRKRKQLFRKAGKEGQPIYADTIRKDIVIEGWQPNEWGRW
jgi:hypothetical protein